MAWVQRDGTGAICGVYVNQQPGFADEQLSDNDPAVVTYLNPPPRDPVDSWDIITLKIAFAHENRIRVLEGKPQVTLLQFKTFVRSQL